MNAIEAIKEMIEDHNESNEQRRAAIDKAEKEIIKKAGRQAARKNEMTTKEMMTPCQELKAAGAEISDAWDWNARPPMWVWNKIAIDGYPDWEMYGESPPFVMLEHAHDAPSSRDMAVAFDDIATGLFYYRDWTSSGLPFLDEGDLAWSGFWFQNMREAEAFHTLNAGAASWLPDFEPKRDAMRARRNR